MPTVMPAISPVIAPVGGSQVPARFGGPVSLTRLMKYKGKSSRMRNGVMVVMGIALVAGAVKLMVSSATPKLATAAAAGDPVPAPAPATEPTTAPAAKTKTILTADAKGSNAKPIPTPGTTVAKPRNAATDGKGPKKFGAGSAQGRSAGKTSTGSKGTLVSAGAEHVDKTAGYAVKFPTGWTQRDLSGRGSWLAEASDGKSSSVAIGLSPDGGRGVADAKTLESLTKSYQSRPDTIVQGSGFGTIAGQKCMWHKLSVPAPAAPGTAAAAAPDAGATPARTSVVQYFAPLGDGRALKVRVVSKPETFAEAARTVKQSLNTLRLLTPEESGKQVAAGE
jgi:hypothetical protein